MKMPAAMAFSITAPEILSRGLHGCWPQVRAFAREWCLTGQSTPQTWCPRWDQYSDLFPPSLRENRSERSYSSMLPGELKPQDFSSYPPEARKLVLNYLGTLRQLPISFVPGLL